MYEVGKVLGWFVIALAFLFIYLVETYTDPYLPFPSVSYKRNLTNHSMMICEFNREVEALICRPPKNKQTIKILDKVWI